MGKSKKNISENEEEYVVEDILDDKFEDGIRFYKIKWEGYPISDCTWEPSENLSKSLIKQYEISRKKKIPFSKVKLDKGESDSGEEDNEPKMKEILDSCEENGKLKYQVLFTDGESKWLKAKKVKGRRLVEAFQAKKTNEELSRKRSKNFSETESEVEITSKKRNYSRSISSFDEVNSPGSKKSEGTRKSSRILARIWDNTIERGSCTPTSALEKDFSSIPNTPSTPKSQSKGNSLPENPTSSEVKNNVFSSELSNSKKNNNKKSKVKSNENKREHYNIEKIVDHRVVDGIKEYKVRWENCSSEEDTWKPLDTFKDSNLVTEYENLTVSLKSSKSTSKAKCGFLQRLMKNTKKGVAYNESEIIGILDKHYNKDHDGFFLVLLKNKEIVYICPDDIPSNFKEECIHAERKRTFNC